MTETVMTKAQRLPVRVLHHDQRVTVADVTGDHDPYRVNVLRGGNLDAARYYAATGDYEGAQQLDPSVWCSCPSQVEACSHVLALALKLKEQQ